LVQLAAALAQSDTAESKAAMKTVMDRFLNPNAYTNQQGGLDVNSQEFQDFLKRLAQGFNVGG